MLTIGRLAKLTGIEAKTLRYCDRVGLVPPAGRTAAKYRLYSEDAVARLRFIRRAKGLEAEDCPCFEIIQAFRKPTTGARARHDIRSKQRGH